MDQVSPMRPQRVYLDTSVIGGLFDAEFSEDSRRLFEAIRAGRAVALISETTTGELAPAPPHVQAAVLELPSDALLELGGSAEVDQLTEAYLAAGVVTKRYREDAAHIAYATVYGADVVASWNFRHIVNLERIQQFNAVNLMQGYRTVEIRSPRELFRTDDEQNDAAEENV